MSDDRPTAETALSLVDEIYAAATDPSRWPAVLESLRRATGSVAAGLFVQNRQELSGHLPFQVGGEPKYVRRYHEYYASRNPWFQHAHRIRDGAVTSGLVHEVFGDSEYYVDFWKPQGFGHTLAAYAYNQSSELGGIVVVQPDGAPPFSPGHVALFEILVGHLQRAIQVHGRMHQLAARSTAVLEYLPQGVVLLDRQERVLALNGKARAILDRRDGLAVKDGLLQVCAMNGAPVFRRLLREAVSGGAREGVGSGGMMKLPRTRGDGELEVLIAPLKASADMFGGHDAVAAVFIADGESALSIDPDALRQLFDLTQAESRVAVELAAGRSVDEISRDLDISLNTARTHLKRIFDKTDTNRQAELVTRLSKSIASLAPSPFVPPSTPPKSRV